MKKVTAIVPMRHSSERVPGKNLRALSGVPLYHHVVRSLLRCEDISQVIVDTDSEQIREELASSFPDVRVLERPAHLRDGEISMNQVLAHTISQVPSEIYLQTHSTNPLLSVDTIGRAVSRFKNRTAPEDSLFSVTRLQTRLWTHDGQPMNHDPGCLLRTQDLVPVYEENSCVYIFTRQSFAAAGGRIGSHPILFEMDGIESWDIDTEDDFRIAEALSALHSPSSSRESGGSE